MKQTKPSTQTHPMDLLLGTVQQKSLKKGTEVDARIVSVSKKGVVFDIGAKAPAVLGNKETKELTTYLPYLQAKETIRVRVVADESRYGYPVVSLQRFFEKGKWDILHEKRTNEEEIEVVCGEFGKGGVFIDFMGIRGVIPKIQLTHNFLDDPSKLQSEKIRVKVLEVDEAKNRLVVSQKAAALNISQKQVREKFDTIEVGKAYEARALGLSEFGIFCEVDGVEGLIHISEISWEKVGDAAQFVKPGDAIQVLVVEKNEADMKLNLSIKRLSKDPWGDIEERYPKDKEFEGEVVRHEPYGYFVRLEPGIEGLIHVSKLAEGSAFKVGDKVKIFVERVNKRDRKLSLILPQTDRPILYR